MHDHCFSCPKRINWYCSEYDLEIPLFQKPEVCTVKINPKILEDILKRRNINNYAKD